MGYKILFKELGATRREAWNNKVYLNKAGAHKVINAAVAQYKRSKYVKDVKPKNFKIVKKYSSRSRGVYGMNLPREGIWG